MYACPEARIGDVFDFGFAKIFRNVAKCASGVISFECSELVVVGTLRNPFESYGERVVGRRQVLDERPRLRPGASRRAGCR